MTVKGLHKAQMWCDWNDGREWIRAKTSVIIYMLNGNGEGGVTCVQYSFNGEKWNPCLEIEMPIIIHCKEALYNNLWTKTELMSPGILV